RDDQTIKNVRNEDPKDLARQARVEASNALEHAEPRFVINGVTRDIPRRSINRWTTEMTPQGPWLELSWAKPHALRAIQLTFDSGFQRELTLTASDGINQGIIRAAQPETVRDYTISYRKAAAGPWVELLKVDGNYQRLNRHRFTPIEAQALRVHVRATNGD